MPTSQKKRILSETQRVRVLAVLETRFARRAHLHPGIVWAKVRTRLEADPSALWSLHRMEETGGEPDVAWEDKKTRGYVFCDTSAESPAGRRSLCFDKAARESRKEHPPGTSAHELAAGMGIELLTEAEYRALQAIDAFDRKTSSWIQTPPAIRKLGGALFCDRRYEAVFTYHNGADSYYAARGFRGKRSV